MGACLGTLGSLVLMIVNIGAIRELLAGGAAAGLPTAVFIATSACAIAVGATLTGVIFSAMERD